MDVDEALEAITTALNEAEKAIHTLRTTAELAYPSLRDYVLAQSRMADRWAEADDAVKRQLWKDLHFCEAGGREALTALEADRSEGTPSERSESPPCSD